MAHDETASAETVLGFANTHADRFGRIERFGDAAGLSAWLTENGLGEAAADVTAAELASELAEAVAGLTLVALLTRGTELGEAWVDRTTMLLLKGISA